MFFTINVDVKMFFTTMLLFYGTITLFFIFDNSNNLIITIGMEEFKPEVFSLEITITIN